MIRTLQLHIGGFVGFLLNWTQTRLQSGQVFFGRVNLQLPAMDYPARSSFHPIAMSPTGKHHIIILFFSLLQIQGGSEPYVQIF